jgi:hypothetical protein
MSSVEFDLDVVSLVKEHLKIDASMLDRDPTAGLKWLDLSKFGYLGSVLVFRDRKGGWKALNLPYDSKSLGVTL